MSIVNKEQKVAQQKRFTINLRSPSLFLLKILENLFHILICTFDIRIVPNFDSLL